MKPEGDGDRGTYGEATIEHEEGTLEEPEDNGVGGPAAELDDGTSNSNRC